MGLDEFIVWERVACEGIEMAGAKWSVSKFWGRQMDPLAPKFFIMLY